ncbi:MAG TPA: hypothetical protein EYP19_03690 [Desulfobacterales bacterium]|nr:hypothetical protein [Desulfobacterales bacterium]
MKREAEPLTKGFQLLGKVIPGEKIGTIFFLQFIANPRKILHKGFNFLKGNINKSKDLKKSISRLEWRLVMGFNLKTTDELVELAKAGGGFVLEVGKRNTDELVRIAEAARKSRSTVIFRKIGVRKNASLMKIAAAGKGHVIFES